MRVWLKPDLKIISKEFPEKPLLVFMTSWCLQHCFYLCCYDWRSFQYKHTNNWHDSNESKCALCTVHSMKMMHHLQYAVLCLPISSMQLNSIYVIIHPHNRKKPFLLCTFMFLCGSEHWSNSIFRELSNSHSIHCIFASRTSFQLPFQCKYLYRLNFYSLFIKFLAIDMSIHKDW